MHFLITAGGTREYIDPVRFISNASSGKTGLALAGAALKAGHKVTLIAASITQKFPAEAKIVMVQTTSEMFEAVKKHFKKCDCLIMAAAVADYTVARPAKNKIKKTNKSLTIKLKPTPDILEWAAKNRISRGVSHCGKKGQNQIVVGFALEDKSLRESAEKKLKVKNLDMIVANSPAAIGADKATVQIKTPDMPWVKLADTTKAGAAKKIIAMAEKCLSQS